MISLNFRALVIHSINLEIFQKYCSHFVEPHVIKNIYFKCVFKLIIDCPKSYENYHSNVLELSDTNGW